MGVTLSSHDGGTPSSHGAGTNPHLGWVDTIPGMGWVGVPHPSSWLSTLSRGYLPWLGGNYLGQEGTSSNVGTYSQEIYPYPGYIPLPPHLPWPGVFTLDGGVCHWTKVPQPVFVTPSQVMYPPSQGKYPSPTQLRSWGPLLGRISNEGNTLDPGIGSLILGYPHQTCKQV